MVDLESWNQEAAEEVSTKELDDLVIQMQADWDAFEVQNDKAKELRAVYDTTEAKLLELIKRAGKTKWNAEGIGTAYVINKYAITTPKTGSAKEKLFAYIKERHGPETLLGLLSINSQTLNSFVNKELENNPLENIPGLDPPTHRESLGFRKERRK